MAERAEGAGDIVLSVAGDLVDRISGDPEAGRSFAGLPPERVVRIQHGIANVVRQALGGHEFTEAELVRLGKQHEQARITGREYDKAMGVHLPAALGRFGVEHLLPALVPVAAAARPYIVQGEDTAA